VDCSNRSALPRRQRFKSAPLGVATHCVDPLLPSPPTTAFPCPCLPTARSQRAWTESRSRCPLICLLSPGSDPTKLIEDLAKRKKIKTLGVSMGQGQEVGVAGLECTGLHSISWGRAASLRPPRPRRGGGTLHTARRA
jgi:hypothetical protein